MPGVMAGCRQGGHPRILGWLFGLCDRGDNVVGRFDVEGCRPTITIESVSAKGDHDLACAYAGERWTQARKKGTAMKVRRLASLLLLVSIVAGLGETSSAAGGRGILPAGPPRFRARRVGQSGLAGA